METDNDILEIKFEGNQVNPDTIKPHEVAELIINFEKALLSTIKQEHPEIDTDHLLFSFHSIENRSLDLKFKAHTAKAIVVSSYALISTAINTSQYTKLNYDTIESLREISKFTKRHDCVGYFRYDDKAISTFTKDTEITFDRSNELKGETRIYGKVVRVGGESPTLHFKINDEYKIVIDVKEDLAKELAKNLYEEIGLVGVAKWDSISYKVIDFKVADIVELDNKPIKETFAELRNLLGKHWDKIDDINSVI
jgi:hypothetical protein